MNRSANGAPSGARGRGHAEPDVAADALSSLVSSKTLMLNARTLAGIQRAIADAGVDGWLLYDFRRINPIAAGMLAREGMLTRRIFCHVPRSGNPVAITHAIEQGPWLDWPSGWGKEVYSSWKSLESTLRAVVGGKRVAMEYSPGDAVPYVDRIPAGVGTTAGLTLVAFSTELNGH